MFDLDKFLSEAEVEIEAINFKITDRRTGLTESRTFFYPTFEPRSLTMINGYGYDVEMIGDRAIAKGKLSLGLLWGEFVEKGGLE